MADDATVAARLLDQPIEALPSSGPSGPLRWEFAFLVQGAPLSVAQAPAPVAGGRDSLEQMGRKEVLRLDGVRSQQENRDGVAGAFITTVTGLQPDSPMLVTFFYKARGCQRYDLGIWTPLVQEGSVSLPDTAGAWWKAALVVWPQQKKGEFRLLNVGACQGWFGDIQIRALDVDRPLPLTALPNRLGDYAIAAVSGVGWTRAWWTIATPSAR
jgi:hypothetical protein